MLDQLLANHTHQEQVKEHASRVSGSIFAQTASQITDASTDSSEVTRMLQRQMMQRLRAYDVAMRAGTLLAQPKFLENESC